MADLMGGLAIVSARDVAPRADGAIMAALAQMELRDQARMRYRFDQQTPRCGKKFGRAAAAGDRQLGRVCFMRVQVMQA